MKLEKKLEGWFYILAKKKKNNKRKKKKKKGKSLKDSNRQKANYKCIFLSETKPNETRLWSLKWKSHV